jgi:chromosome segregation ATPase
MKKDLFNLQLENHFLKDRLANTTDEHFRAMHNENVKLKLEMVNYAKEIKRLKKIILQQDKGMKELQRQLDEMPNRSQGDAQAQELERLWREEKDRRKRLETVVREYESGKGDLSTLRTQLDEVEQGEAAWRTRCEELEEEMKATAEDHAGEIDKLRDEVDRAQEEIEKLQSEGGSGGLGKEEEDALHRQIADLEEVSLFAGARDIADKQELERAKREGGDEEELQEVRYPSSS